MPSAVTPGVIGLLLVEVMLAILLCRTLPYALNASFRWKRHPGQREQLLLERRAYLVETVTRWAALGMVPAWFAMVGLTDALHEKVTGAMCATGVFGTNAWGYPTVLVTALASVAAGIWLVLDGVDRHTEQNALMAVKSRVSVALSLLVFSSAGGAAAFYWSIDDNIVATCCGVVFDRNQADGATQVFFFSDREIVLAVGLSAFFALANGVRFFGSHQPGWLQAVLTLSVAATGVVALIEIVSPHVYELPAHRCPFCLFKGIYGGVGYLFSALIWGSLVGATGGWLIRLFRSHQGQSEAERDWLNGVSRWLGRVSWMATAAGLGLGIFYVYFRSTTF